MSLYIGNDMRIPFIDSRDDLDCCSRYYRRAIYNTLLELKPEFCLEIGTHIYQTSSVFSRYFDEVCPDGKLITTDIGTFNRNPHPPKGVYPVMVYPHYAGVEDDHGGLYVYYPDYREMVDHSAVFNRLYIKAEMNRLGIDEFTFVFIDGGHQLVDITRDLEIAQSLTAENGYILIDDVWDSNYVDLTQFYQQLKNNGSIFYEYDTWNPRPGFALACNKDIYPI